MKTIMTDFKPMTLKFNIVLEVCQGTLFVQNVIKLSAAVHELSYSQRNREEKLCINGDNNAAVASAGSNN